jgi:prolyl oligopeptidase
MIWMDNLKGMYAVADIRGGGDLGEEWHEAGMREKRQNVFDDLAYAAKYLHKNKYSTPDFTAINGGSNGGTVVAVTANQNPDLFGAVVSDVPVVDMLRFHKFTIGSAWAPEYGSTDEKGDVEYLLKYDPIRTIRPV